MDKALFEKLVVAQMDKIFRGFHENESSSPLSQEQVTVPCLKSAEFSISDGIVLTVVISSFQLRQGS
jgi:hypothetical protein